MKSSPTVPQWYKANWRVKFIESGEKLGSGFGALQGKGWKERAERELERALLSPFIISEPPWLDRESTVEGGRFLIPTPQTSAPKSLVTETLP